MEITLYHYVHCPFCLRVRLALGYLGLNYQSVVLPYHDEKTPMALSGTKMLPILVLNGKAMNESLEIIKELDQDDKLDLKAFMQEPSFADFETLLNKLGNPIHSLAMPYWIYTPEFDSDARRYFQVKKEQKRGPFAKLVHKQSEFIEVLQQEFLKLTKELMPFYRSHTFAAADLMLASHLWGLYVVPEFQFPAEIHHYLQSIKNICHFNYHQDFWR